MREDVLKNANGQDIYEKLNEINYGQKFVPYCAGELGSLKQYEVSDIILKDIQTVNKCIEKNEGLYLGTISSGAHTKDFEHIYSVNTQKWNATPIMLVFDCPSNNLDFCFKNPKDETNAIDEIRLGTDVVISNELIKSFLCNCVWHASIRSDEDVKEWNNGVPYDKFWKMNRQKAYDALVLSIVKEFELGNFYTTNFWRYEIYKNENGTEKALNLGQIAQIMKNSAAKKDKDKIYIPLVFEEELKVMQPKVIFASGNAFNYIKYTAYWENCDDKPLLVKIPHPANRDNELTRLLRNVFGFAHALYKTGIMDEETYKDKMKELADRYYDIESGDKSIEESRL